MAASWAARGSAEPPRIPAPLGPAAGIQSFADRGFYCCALRVTWQKAADYFPHALPGLQALNHHVSCNQTGMPLKTTRI